MDHSSESDIMALLCSWVPGQWDMQHELDPVPDAAKWNPTIINLIIYTSVSLKCFLWAAHVYYFTC